jgi:hypothetical protein
VANEIMPSRATTVSATESSVNSLIDADLSNALVRIGTGFPLAACRPRKQSSLDASWTVLSYKSLYLQAASKHERVHHVVRDVEARVERLRRLGALGDDLLVGQRAAKERLHPPPANALDGQQHAAQHVLLRV